MTQVAISIIWCIVQVSLLCAAGGLLYLGVRVFEPRLGRTSVAVLLLLVTVLSLTALSPWPSWRFAMRGPNVETTPVERTIENRGPAAAQTASRTAMDSDVVPHAEGQGHVPGATFWQALWDELNHPRAASESSVTPSAASPWHWSVVLLACLSIAAAIGGLRLVVACISLRSWKRTSTTISSPRLQWLVSRMQREMGACRSLELREVAALRSAATMGWRQPVILLPSAWRGWPEAELKAVLAHELAHVQARDWPTWLLAQFAVTLHFYHPLVHWLAGRLQLEQELAADATAAAVTGSREAYLGTLASQMLRTDKARLTWAAQTFLPTRSTIVRRIEMHKSESRLPLKGRQPGRGRFAVVTALLAVGLVVSGLRGPDGETANSALAQQTDGLAVGQRAGQAEPTRKESDSRLEIVARYADANAIFFAYTRPREILESNEIAPIKAQINQFLVTSGAEFSGLKVEDLEVFAISPYLTADRHEVVTAILKFARPIAESQLRAARSEYRIVETVGDYRLYSVSGGPAGKAALLLNSDMLILENSYDRLKELAAKLVGDTASHPVWLREASALQENPQFWMALNMDLVRPEFARAARSGQPQGPFPLAMLSPLIEKPTAVLITGNFAPDLELNVVAACRNDADAQQVTQTAQALVTLARNMLAQQRNATPPVGTPQAMIAGTIEMADRLLQQARLETHGNEVRLHIAAGSLSQQLIQMGFVLPAIQSARQAAFRVQSINNLKQLALAMHNYHDAHGHFPPPIVTGPDGKTKHSWRVAILPFIDQVALYNEYRLTEPWDSEHNQRVLESMPALFASPTEPSGSTASAYYVLVGKETVFETAGDGVKLQNILDGTSNTLLIVEARRDTPWTQPEDISFSKDQPMPKLGGFFDSIFLAALADGSVHAIDQQIDPTILRRMIEKADGEPVQR